MTTNLPVYDPVRKERYVQHVILGLSPHQAAAATGFPNPGHAVAALKKDEQVLAMLEAYRLQLREQFRYDRDKAVGMLMVAYDVAKLQDDAKGMTGAVRELNDMHGYHAPTEISIKSTNQGSRRALAELSDAELMEAGGVVLDGDFEEEEGAGET